MAIAIGSSALPSKYNTTFNLYEYFPAKRQAQNSYGDEPQTPAPTSYSEATTGAAVEYAPHEVAQEAVSAAAPVQSSGYRHKRQAQNSYGDEAQTPAPSTYSGASAAVSAETAPAQVIVQSVLVRFHKAQSKKLQCFFEHELFDSYTFTGCPGIGPRSGSSLIGISP